MSGARGRRGLTLVELVLAIGLLALLMLAVFQLFDRSLSVWRRGETRRALLEQASTVLESLALDLRGLEPGSQGDVVLEWVRFDTDGDNVLETKWPRLRLVRQASAAEMARAAVRDEESVDKAKASAEKADAAREPVLVPPSSPGLLEVVWMVAPASLTQPDARSEGVIFRGERPTTESASKSFFAGDFFGASNRPPAGATEEVTGGLLWLGILCAGQTAVVNDGWKLGSGLECAATSWDAHGLNRPEREVHPWNEPHPGQPKPKGRALLPRRVRIELEFERPADRSRRTRILQAVDNQENVLLVDDGRRLPTEAGAHVLVDAEWFRVTSIDGGRVAVQRAQRGTSAAPHAPGALVHWGLSLVREVPVATYREDWNL
ncbi:MAG: prepilin-type N-terminal cleavage/methylation domain-containing protein [Planctomycetota bacterium]|nr:prepilin-type N-terminal cleavage/methylation domain-containing protein [Planctomycetota bacterium]